MSKVEDFLRKNAEVGAVLIWYDKDNERFVAVFSNPEVHEDSKVTGLSPFSLLDKLDRKGE